MDTYDREQIEKYREFLKNQIEACEHLVGNFESSNEEETKKYWFYRTAYKQSLEELNKLLPEPQYLPKWVGYLAYGIIGLSILFVLLVASRH